MLFYTFLILIFCSCGRTSKSTTPSGEGKEITLAYAQNLRMTAFEGYTRVELRDPWKPGKTLHTYYLVGHEGTQPPGDGTVVYVPLERMVVFTTAHANLLEWLGEGQRIAGVADAKYMLIPDVQRRLRLTEAKDAIADCGEAMNPNVERIVDLQSDAVLLSPSRTVAGMACSKRRGFPSSNVPTIWRLRPWGVRNGCASTDGWWGAASRPTVCFGSWNVNTNGFLPSPRATRSVGASCLSARLDPPGICQEAEAAWD